MNFFFCFETEFTYFKLQFLIDDPDRLPLYPGNQNTNNTSNNSSNSNNNNNNVNTNSNSNIVAIVNKEKTEINLKKTSTIKELFKKPIVESRYQKIKPRPVRVRNIFRFFC